MIEDKEEIQVDIEELIDDLEVEGNRAKPEAKAKSEEPKNEIKPEVVDGLQKQLEALKAERDAERQARAQAELDAKKMAQAAQQARSSADHSYHQLVEGYVHQAKSRAEQLKREIKLALDAGEYDKVSDLQMEAAKVAARQLQYEDTKADLEARAQRARQEPKIEEHIVPSDPFEAQIASLSEPSKNWLRQHKECVTDDVSSAKVMLGDKLARRQGLVPDSKEYFEFIEEHMGYRQKPQEQPQEATSEDDGEEVEIIEAKPVKKPLPSAPVSREAGHQGKLVNGKYRLTRAEAETADDWGWSHADYAKMKIAAEKAGRYSN